METKIQPSSDEVNMRGIDWYKIGILIAIGLCLLSTVRALPQDTGRTADSSNPELSGSPNPGLSHFISEIPQGPLIESGILPKALKEYWKASRELHQGESVAAERDAARALKIDRTFADAAALKATAALQQGHFEGALQDAAHAIQLNPSDEKAWVILATAYNHLDRYSEDVEALRQVRPQDLGTWQVSYQWARAEAGLEHLQQCVAWADRAALSAPADFAPLHLLRASALLALGKVELAADQLNVYFQLPDVPASQRARLMQELKRLQP